MGNVTNKGLPQPIGFEDPTSFNWRKWLDMLRARFPRTDSYDISINPTSIAANTVADQTFTVTGLVLLRDVVIGYQSPQLTAGLVVHQVRVSADDTLQIRFENTTGGAIDEAAATWTILTMGK